jgi:hypothetical protein
MTMYRQFPFRCSYWARPTKQKNDPSKLSVQSK